MTARFPTPHATLKYFGGIISMQVVKGMIWPWDHVCAGYSDASDSWYSEDHNL